MRIDDDTPEPGTIPSVYPKRPPVNLVLNPRALSPNNLFAFEGIDGAGKSELLSRVRVALETQGHKSRKLRLGRSDVTHHALERAKWLNSNPLSINLLSWVSIYEQVAEAQDELNSDTVLLFDRYVLTLMVRGILEGLPTDYMHLLESYAPRPRHLFLIDSSPETCLQRILSGGRTISYFEAGSRIVEDQHQPMTEASPSIRQGGDRTAGLLTHLKRMRAGLFDLANEYENVVVIDNSGPPEAALGKIMDLISCTVRENA